MGSLQGQTTLTVDFYFAFSAFFAVYTSIKSFCNREINEKTAKWCQKKPLLPVFPQDFELWKPVLNLIP